MLNSSLLKAHPQKDFSVEQTGGTAVINSEQIDHFYTGNMVPFQEPFQTLMHFCSLARRWGAPQPAGNAVAATGTPQVHDAQRTSCLQQHKPLVNTFNYGLNPSNTLKYYTKKIRSALKAANR